jgi:hypothetical protein
MPVMEAEMPVMEAEMPVMKTTVAEEHSEL